MRKMQTRSTLSIVNIAGNACTAVLFVIRSSCAQGASEIIVTSRRLPKAPRADSESQILAMKKFSCLMPGDLICRSPRTVFWANRARRFGSRGFLARRRNAARGARSRQFGDAAIGRRRLPPPRARRSDAELGLEQVVDGLRIGLAARRLHHLADEPADHLRLGFRLRDLVGIAGDDVVDH